MALALNRSQKLIDYQITEQTAPPQKQKTKQNKTKTKTNKQTKTDKTIAKNVNRNVQ